MHSGISFLCWVILISRLGVHSQLHSQPVVTVTDLRLMWPTVLVHVKVECNGELRFDAGKERFRIRENGADVTNFSLSCTDTSSYCPMSVALVFDASGSMGTGPGSALESAKTAGRIFLGTMHTDVDEGTIVSFAGSASVIQRMTNDLLLLRFGIENLASGGGTAVWDGMLAGIQQIAGAAINPCRAVVLLTDGIDNASRSNLSEVIDSAAIHGIIVYPIGLGTSIDTVSLIRIAQQTGGKYYHAPNASELGNIYRSISSLIMYGAGSCTLSYDGTCRSGGARQVDIYLDSMCGGNDSTTVFYQAPDSVSQSNAMPLFVRVGQTIGPAGSAARVPITIGDTLADNLFLPADITLQYDSALLTFVGLDSPPGTLFSGRNVTSTDHRGTVLIHLQDSFRASAKGTVTYLVFRTANLSDTMCANVIIRRWSFKEGCSLPVISNGEICITPCSLSPRIDTPDGTTFCKGEDLLLRATRGFQSYLWYLDGKPTGSTSEYLRLGVPGSYSVQVRDSAGCTGTSAPVTVAEQSRLSLSVGNRQTLIIRSGDSFSLPVYCTASDSMQGTARSDLTLHFDARYLGYQGIDSSGTIGRLHLLAHDAAEETVRVLCDAEVDNVSGLMFAFRFFVKGAPVKSEALLFRFEDVGLLSKCHVLSTVQQPYLIIDGACEKVLIRRQGVRLSVAPNPVSVSQPAGGSSMMIHVEVSEETNASLFVSSPVGERIQLLPNTMWSKGLHRVPFDATGLTAGVYFVSWISPQGITSQPFLVLK